MTSLLDWDIPTLQNALDRHTVSLEEVIGAYSQRISEKNPVVHAFLDPIIEPPAVASQGTIAGIPVAVKDIMDLHGWSTRAGSSFYCQQPPTDSFAVARLREQGALFWGKTNTHEFAAGGTTLNPHFGPTRNPWNPAHMVGGSSGGSAAAVAARMALAALGTDTAGSVRIPAALCGIVGLKPTYGRISRSGVVTLSWSLDHVGPLARTVQDTAIIYRLLNVPDPHDFATVSHPPEARPLPQPVRVGVDASLISQAHAEVGEAVQHLARQLQDAGYVLVPVQLPLWKASQTANFTIIRAEASTFHQPWYDAQPQAYGDDVRAYLEVGNRILAVDYLKSLQIRRMVTQAYQALWETVDLLLLPTTPEVAPAIDGFDPVTHPTLTTYTAPFDLAGLPALTVPVRGHGQLPVGIQWIAPWWQEEWLFTIGQVVENLRGPWTLPE